MQHGPPDRTSPQLLPRYTSPVQQEVPAPTLAQLKPGLPYNQQMALGLTVRNSAGTPVSWLSGRPQTATGPER